jgi:hypothetical protein
VCNVVLFSSDYAVFILNKGDMGYLFDGCDVDHKTTEDVLNLCKKHGSLFIYLFSYLFIFLFNLELYHT